MIELNYYPIEVAAQKSGYSVEALEQLAKEGKIPIYSQKHRGEFVVHSIREFDPAMNYLGKIVIDAETLKRLMQDSVSDHSKGNERIGWHQELNQIIQSFPIVLKDNRLVRQAIRKRIDDDSTESVFSSVNITNGDATWLTGEGEEKKISKSTLDKQIAKFSKQNKSIA